MKTFRVCLVTIFCLSFLHISLKAQEAKRSLGKEADHARLKLPWEIIKGMLKIDQDEVQLTWDEFQTLIQHTVQKKVPKFSMSNGSVVLSRSELRRLIDSLVPPLPQEPAIYITKAIYRAKLEDETVQISASLQIHVNAKVEKEMQINLFPGNLAFQEILLEDKPAFIEERQGRLYLTTSRSGSFLVKLRFSVKNPGAQSAHTISFPVARTPITQLDMIIPERNVDVQVSQALQTELRSVTEGTEVNATLFPTEIVSVSWNPVAPLTSKSPARIYADMNHLLSIEDDTLRVKSSVNIQVLQNTVNSLTLEIPQGFNVIDVQGDYMGDWVESSGNVSLLTIPFQHARQGSFRLQVTLERIFTGNKVAPVFTGLKVRDVTRERGFLGVELRTSAEITVPKISGLERIDIQELPGDIILQSQRPLLYGYKYLRHPYELVLAIERHKDVHLLTSMIDLASVVSLLMKDGRLVHQITYRLRNSGKQFLEVSLPRGAKLWSVFVAGQPAKPSNTSNERILVPLNRSQSLQGVLSAFEVELIYYEESSRLFPFGRRRLQFPVPDTMISRLLWSVYVPLDKNFYYLGRDFERLAEERIAGTGTTSVSSAIDLVAKKHRSVSTSKANASKEYGFVGDYEYQLESEDKLLRGLGGELPAASMKEKMDKVTSGRKNAMVAGVLPIRVHVPISGRVYRFSKDLLVKNELLPLPLYHASIWLCKTIKLFFLGVFVFWFYSIRVKIIGFSKKAWPFIEPYKVWFKPAITPFGLVITMTILSLLGSYLSLGWLSVALLGFLTAITRWLLSIVRVRAVKG